MGFCIGLLGRCREYSKGNDMKRMGVLIFFLVFVGCGPGAQPVDWVGSNSASLIAKEGNPDSVMSDDYGGQIYTYVRQVHYGLPDYYGSYYGYPTYSYGYGPRYRFYYGPTKTIIGKKMYWVDPTGRIYRTSETD